MLNEPWRPRAEGCLPLHLGFPVLTVRGSVHCVPKLEAGGMFVPQFLQLRPQQDVFLGLQKTDHPVRTGDSGPALGDLYRDRPKSHHDTLGHTPGPHSLTHTLLEADAET